MIKALLLDFSPILIAFILGVVVSGLYFSRKTILFAKIAQIKQQSIEDLNKETTQLQTANSTLKIQLQETKIALVKNTTKLESELSLSKEKQELLQKSEQKLTDTFRSLSSQALAESNAQFLQLAKQSLQLQQNKATEELEKKHLAFSQLVTPIQENLGKVQNQIGEIEKNRHQSHAELRTEISHLQQTHTHLQKETSQLVKALRQPTTRGQWGELQLQKVVEMAGMQQHCDFVLQSGITSNTGTQLRPDLVVQLPGGKTVVVDSKTPMDAYLEAIETNNEAEKTTQLKRHAKQIRTHITQLSSKDYAAQFKNSPEFIVLFLPSEAFFSAALHSDPELIEKGAQQNIILATPTTLIALLRAVSYGWRQQALEENAREIAVLGKELHHRIGTLTEHFIKLGKSLDTATLYYNKTISSLESRVLTSARKFEDLKVSTPQNSLAKPSPLESISRIPLSSATEEDSSCEN